MRTDNGGLLAPPATALLSASAAAGRPVLSAMPGTTATPAAKLRQVGRMFLRRGWLIVLMLAGFNGITLLGMSRLTPRYTAEASLIIGPREAQVVDVKAVIAGLSADTDVIESEMQILHSRHIAEAVVSRLGLDRTPEFLPAPAGPSLRERLTVWLATRLHTLAAWLPAWLRPQPDALAFLQSAAPQPAAVHTPLERATDAFVRHLWVSQKGRARVIGVAFDSADPVLAAAAANGVSEAYIENQISSKVDATEHAHHWLDERVRELREQVINADQAVEAYQRKIGLVQGRTGSLLAEQMSALDEQIVHAQVERASAEARLQTVDRALAGPGGITGLPEIQGSAVVQALRAQESKLLQNAAELSRSFGESYPRLAATRSEIADVQGRLWQEVARIAAGLRENVNSTQMRENYLETMLDRLRSEAGTGRKGEIELHALQHEADADRALYDRLLTRSKETSVESGLQQPDAQIISRAEPPETPSFPNPTLILPIFFVASCIVVVLLVFAVETLDQGFTNLDQIEEMLGVPGLAVMPRLRRLGRAQGSLQGEGLDRSQQGDGRLVAHYNEAVRSLYTSLLLSDVARPPKVVLIASALPDEGKTTIGLALARLMARSGKRVAMVDCDLRRPALHKAFGVPRGPGLTDCLSGGAVLDEILREDSMSSAQLLAAGSQVQTAPDLFATVAIRRLVATLSERFDLVILDSAPVLAVSDTRTLCRLGDAVVFVVRWEATGRRAVQMALRQIIDAGGQVAGALLAQVDLKRYARHSAVGLYHHQIRLYLGDRA